MPKRQFFNGLLFCISICVFGFADERLNILLITVDDMNRDSVGVFGCRVPGTTPNIDRFASTGIRFEHAHVTIAICQPTRAVWMTGRYPHSNGALGFDPISADVPTIVEALHESGYSTTLLSKTTHVVPTRSGAWDTRIKRTELGLGRASQKYYLQTKRAITSASKADKPFFLMANIDDPHRPFAGSQQERNRREKRGDRFPAPTKTFGPDEIQVPGFLPDLPDVRQEMAQYYSSVHRADQSVGAILRALDESDAKQKTVVIFMSDHGMPLPFAKTNCWRHSTITPWIVRWPSVAKPASVDSEHVISGTDLAPTILEIAGLTPFAGIEGRSIVGLLKGGSQTKRDFAFTQINRTSGKNEYAMRSVQGKRFGYIFNAWANGETIFKNESQAGLTMKAMRLAAKNDVNLAQRVEHFLRRCPEEFYDYQSDPDSLHNLINDPEHQPTIERYRAALMQHMEETVDPQLANFKKIYPREDKQ